MTDDKIDYDKLADAMLAKLRQMDVSRREMLAALGGGGAASLGMLLGTNSAAAQSDPIDGVLKADQIGTTSDPVKKLVVENQVNYNQTESFESIITGDVEITPVDSGTISLSGNEFTIAVGPSDQYHDGYYHLAITTVSNSGGGRVRKVVSNNNVGDAYFGIEEVEGDPIGVKWALIKLASV